jgi:hypothetical protein
MQEGEPRGWAKITYEKLCPHAHKCIRVNIQSVKTKKQGED